MDSPISLQHQHLCGPATLEFFEPVAPKRPSKLTKSKVSPRPSNFTWMFWDLKGFQSMPSSLGIRPHVEPHAGGRPVAMAVSGGWMGLKPAPSERRALLPLVICAFAKSLQDVSTSTCAASTAIGAFSKQCRGRVGPLSLKHVLLFHKSLQV